jgi:hypothetical protein
MLWMTSAGGAGPSSGVDRGPKGPSSKRDATLGALETREGGGEGSDPSEPGERSRPPRGPVRSPARDPTAPRRWARRVRGRRRGGGRPRCGGDPAWAAGTAHGPGPLERRDIGPTVSRGEAGDARPRRPSPESPCGGYPATRCSAGELGHQASAGRVPLSPSSGRARCPPGPCGPVRWPALPCPGHPVPRPVRGGRDGRRSPWPGGPDDPTPCRGRCLAPVVSPGRSPLSGCTMGWRSHGSSEVLPPGPGRLVPSLQSTHHQEGLVPPGSRAGHPGHIAGRRVFPVKHRGPEGRVSVGRKPIPLVSQCFTWNTSGPTGPRMAGIPPVGGAHGAGDGPGGAS